MEKSKGESLHSSQQAVIKNIWLTYYNNTLLAKGIITKDEHRKMKATINIKYPPTTG